MKSIKLNDLMTIRAFADMHGISDTKVRYLAKEGIVKVVEIGGDSSHKGVQLVIKSKSKIN